MNLNTIVSAAELGIISGLGCIHRSYTEIETEAGKWLRQHDGNWLLGEIKSL